MLSGRKKIIIILLLITFVVSNLIFLKGVFAQADTAIQLKILAETIKEKEMQLKSLTAQEKGLGIDQGIKALIKELKIQQRKLWLLDLWRKIRDNVIIRAGKIAYKNALRTFLSRLAYDTATSLAEGDWGKSPLFSTKNMGDFLDGVYQTTLVDTLDLLAQNNGFLKFDVCEPEDLSLKFAIHYALFKERQGRGAPRCTFREIIDGWGEWVTGIGQSLSPENFLSQMKDAFKPEQTDVGIYLTLDSSIRSRLEDEKSKQTLDQIINAGFKAVTEPITGFIKTPAAFTSEQAKQALIANAPIAETITTGDIVADALGIFTNTLASKLMKRLLEKGLTEGKRAQTTLVYNWANRELAKTGAGQIFAGLAEVSYSSGQERVLEYLTQCPNPQKPGPNDCIMSHKLTTAIEQGLTVKEALAKGNLRGDGLVGYKENGTPTYLDDYPYRSLVIMRINRIIPVGWELAALYAMNKKKEVTLQKLINCFEDSKYRDNPRLPENCRESMDGNESKDDAADYNPYYHLIDPNWVLKAPESYCAKKSFGYEVVTSSTDCSEDNVANTLDPQNNNEPVDGAACDANLINPDKPVVTLTRADNYCADRQSCLEDDASGNCLGEYGYCLKEKDIWRFPGGKTCEPFYSSCETLSRTSDNQSVSYLRNTLKECPQTEAGCQWYSTVQTKNATGTLEWQDDSRIYLNNQAKQCDLKGAGCTKLSRMLPGVNLAFNGDFTLSDDAVLPNGWINENNKTCASYQADGGINNTGGLKLTAGGSVCRSFTSGFIPADPNFSYTFIMASRLNMAGNNSSPAYLYVYDGDFKQIGSPRQIFTPDEAGQVGTAEWQYLTKEISNLSLNTRYLKISLTARNLTVFFDNIQLIISQSPIPSQNLANFAVNQEIYQIDYSQNNTYARQYLKVAPDYLQCEGYNKILFDYTTQEQCQNHGYWRSDIKRCVESGNVSCANFAAFCQAKEIGCQGFRPISGGPEVSAIITTGDQCPAECVGYESYLESPTYFDTIEDPDVEDLKQNFIPETGKSCSAIDAGCEQFTNLDEVASGGEGIEYFTYLRQCVSPNNPNISAYYTWEGSDTTGYQLKKWEFLKSNRDAGPCTNINIGTEQCQDPADPADNLGICTKDDYNLNPNCRDFFNAAGEHFLRWQDRTITASGECHPYRRASSGQVYNADPREGRTCEPAVNGCREYKGNQAGNVRDIIVADFENQITGRFINSASTTLGLTPSNESIQLGGHSLLVYTQNNILAYPLSDVTAGKQYQLSFWAKKGLGEKVSVQNITQGKTFLPFNLNGKHLTNQWQEFKLGPMELDELNGNQPELRLTISGLGADEVFYLDNFILTEYVSTFYLIKDSWSTPVSCDTPYAGANLGCQQYVDRQNQTHFLKTFAKLCSSAAIGCEAYLNTQNSAAYQGEKIYNTGVCNADVGEISVNGNCSIRGQFMCNVQGGSSCIPNTPKVTTVVPNDQMVYLVNDSSKQCNANLQGCELVGLPSLNRQIEDYNDPDYITGYRNTYIINNPDLYGSQLCSESGLFCTAFNGETSGNKSYYDPLMGSLGVGQTSRTCYFSDNKWYQTGSEGESVVECSNNQFLPTAGQYNYDDWVGVCPQEQSSCTEFRDPQTPAGSEVEQCDAQISPRLEGECDFSEGNNGNRVATGDKVYCQLKNELDLPGAGQLVCEATGGTTKCQYSAYDWTCQGFQASYYVQEDIDNNPEKARDEGWVVGALKFRGGATYPYSPEEITGYCEVAGKPVCFIGDSNNNNNNGEPDVCTYSLTCDNYYYLRKSLDLKETCSQVDREAGCLLFNDTSNSSLNISNFSSLDGQGPASCNDEVSYGQAEYCDANLLLQVKKDRQCGQWLECKTGFERKINSTANEEGGGLQINPREFACLDLYRCSEKGRGQKDCSKIVSSAESAQAVYDLTADKNTTEIEAVRNLSGYSHPGLAWDNDITAAGYVSPEQMLQKGQPVPIVNSGFETYLGNSLSNPEGWLAAGAGPRAGVDTDYSNNYCGQILDEKNPYSGHYSLKVTLNTDREDVVCNYKSTAGGSSGFYAINPAYNYNLSFYAKSQDGGQKTMVGIAWYDGSENKILCNNQRNPAYCWPDGQAHRQAGPTGASVTSLLSPPAGQWQKYVLSVGPGTNRPIPPQAHFARIIMSSHSTYNNNEWDSSLGSVWFDDFNIEPILELDPTSDLATAKECRLFPTEEAPACSYTGATQKYEGWKGYCLEPDPFYQIDPAHPNNYQACLQWYPADSLLGDRLSVFDVQDIGYQDRTPLYYCLQTKGLYNYLLRDEDAQVKDGWAQAPMNNTFLATEGYKYQSVISRDTRVDPNQSEDCGQGDDGRTVFINGVHNNVRACTESGQHPFTWEAGCKSNWGCDGYNEEQCNSNQNCAWGYKSCDGFYYPGHIWHSCHDFDLNREDCEDEDDCSPIIGCQGSKTEEQCSAYPANACPSGCVYDDTQHQNRKNDGELAADGWVWVDHDNLTLEDIGAIHFQPNGQGGGSNFKGGFLSDVTEQLDDLEGYTNKSKEYYKKFDKVFYISESDENNYAILMAYGKPPGQSLSRLLRFEFNYYENQRSGGLGGYITYYLKDQCSFIAQTVKTEGGEVKEKTRLNRFDNWTEFNALGYSKTLEPSPYGAFYPPQNTTPEYWSVSDKNAPLYVYDGSNADVGPGAGVPWSVPEVYEVDDYNGSERICVSSNNNSFIGKECFSSKDCGDGGVCGGIDSYCYNKETGLMNGKPCKTAEADCGDPNIYECRLPNLVANKREAINRLQELFAKIYGLWEWDQVIGSGSYGSYKDVTKDYAGLDISESVNTRPQLGNIIVTDANLEAPGGKVELSFTTSGSPDQLPIEGIWIDWQDGSVDYFKGPFSYRPNISLPYQSYHVYTCTTNDRGNRCVACPGGGTPNNGSCTFDKPTVNIKDHWGWCASGDGVKPIYVDEESCVSFEGMFADKQIIISPPS